MAEPKITDAGLASGLADRSKGLPWWQAFSFWEVTKCRTMISFAKIANTMSTVSDSRETQSFASIVNGSKIIQTHQKKSRQS
jgi:hypothetical protein